MAMGQGPATMVYPAPNHPLSTETCYMLVCFFALGVCPHVCVCSGSSSSAAGPSQWSKRQEQLGQS